MISTSLIVLLIVFVVLCVIGFPIAKALAMSACVAVLAVMRVPMTVIVEKLQLGADSYLLMAVPLFILAANIMNASGVSRRIFGFARSIVGSFYGALAHANVLASVVFAGISGSAIADSASLGKIELQAMEEQGYPTDYSAAVTCASATIGPIFPPSIPLVLYAGIASESVGKLFLGGVIPGLMIAAALMVQIAFIAKKNGFPRDGKKTYLQILISFKESFLAILTPVIILCGICFGWFTPTESASITVLYALILGFFVFKELKLSMIPGILKDTLVTSGVVLLIISAASAFSWVLTVGQLGASITAFAASVPNKYLFLLAINLVLLLLGMVMESTAILTVITPFLIPVVRAFGIDLVHFGVMLVLNLMIGMSTPPFGMGLFTVSQVADIPIERSVKAILPFLPVMFIVLILVTYIPGFVTMLPNLLMK